MRYKIYNIYKRDDLLIVNGSSTWHAHPLKTCDLLISFRRDSSEIGKAAISLQLHLLPAMYQSSRELGFTFAVPTYDVIINLADEIWVTDGATLSRLPMRSSDIEVFAPVGDFALSNHDVLGGWLYSPTRFAVGGSPTLSIEDIEVPISLNLSLPQLSLWDTNGECKLGFAIKIRDLLARVRGIDPGFCLSPTKPQTVSLRANGHEIKKKEIQLLPAVDGRVERVSDGRVIGWAVSGKGNTVPANVSLYIGQTRYSSIAAASSRSELRRSGRSQSWGRFEFQVPSWARSGFDQYEGLSISPEFSCEKLPAGVLPDVSVGNVVPSIPYRIITSYGNSRPSLTIIIPIYNAPLQLDRCISAVVANTTTEARLILVDDASSDRRVREVLAKWRHVPNIEIITHVSNIGFTKTVNNAIVQADPDDVVLLNSDTIVGPRWLEHLTFAAYRQHRVGTVTPLSNSAGAFSVPEPDVENRIPLHLDVDSVARLTARASAALHPDAPTGNGFCMFVKRQLIHKIGLFDEIRFPRGYGEENDFCMRASRNGFKNIIDDRTYVYHERSASFGSEKNKLYGQGRNIIDERFPEYTHRIREFFSSDVMNEIRFRVRRGFKQSNEDLSEVLPRILYVISTQTGGTPQTNQDLMRSFSDRYETWVLRSDTKTIFLSRYRAGQYEIEFEHSLRDRISPTTHRSDEYDSIVAQLLCEHAFDLVHIRHIAWHSIGLLDLLHEFNIPTVFSFHDFYTVCPTVKLLDENQNYCAGSCTPTKGLCKAELWPPSSVPQLKHKFIHRWKDMMRFMLVKCDAFVTTSEGTKATILSNYPELESIDFRIIEHGRTFEKMNVLAGGLASSSPLRILVPGNISSAKGADIISSLSKLDRGRYLEFHVLGNAGKLTEGSGIKLHGVYARDKFAEHVELIQPHVGMIFSIWPETYCHTLTELWACGVPCVALDVGAVGERIRRHGGGWALEPHSSVEEIYSKLLEIRASCDEHDHKVQLTVAWQQAVGRNYTSDMMALRYDDLYGDIIDRKRAFRENSISGKRLRYLIHEEGKPAFIGLHEGGIRRGNNSFRIAPDYQIGADGLMELDIVLLSGADFEAGLALEHATSFAQHNLGVCIDLSDNGTGQNLDTVASHLLSQLDSCQKILAIAADRANITSHLNSIGLLDSWRWDAAASFTDSDSRSGKITSRPISGKISGLETRGESKTKNVSLLFVHSEASSADHLLSTVAAATASCIEVADISIISYDARFGHDSAQLSLLSALDLDVNIVHAGPMESTLKLLHDVVSVTAGSAVWFLGGERGTDLAHCSSLLGLISDARIPFVVTDFDTRTGSKPVIADGMAMICDSFFPGRAPEAVIFDARFVKHSLHKCWSSLISARCVAFNTQLASSELAQAPHETTHTFTEAFSWLLPRLIQRDPAVGFMSFCQEGKRAVG